jgi:hypothetical protein
VWKQGALQRWYVELDYGPTVQLMQGSVQRVHVERATEPPTESSKGSLEVRDFRVGVAVRVVGGSY